MHIKLLFSGFQSIDFKEIAYSLKLANRVECFENPLNNMLTVIPTGNPFCLIIPSYLIDEYLHLCANNLKFNSIPTLIVLHSFENLEKITLAIQRRKNIDFVVYPFHHEEFLTRAQVLIKKMAGSETGQSTILSKDKEMNRLMADYKRLTSRLSLEIAKREYSEKKLWDVLNNSNYNTAANEFISNLNHEIRTPLNVIIGFTEILRNKIRQTDVIEYINEIESSAAMMLNLFNDLIDLSKIELGKLDINKQVSSPFEILNEIKELFQNEADTKKLDLNIVYDSDISCQLIFDRKRVKQILIQLVSNAIKFTDTGAVTLSVFTENCDFSGSMCDLFFEIRDTGIGIPVEMQTNVYIPFLSKLNANGFKNNGLGLGLVLAKKLIDLLGGTIEFTSYEFIGSVFRVCIKNVAVASLVGEIDKAFDESALQTLNGLTVAYADNILLNREMVKEYLNSFAINVLIASNANELFELLNQSKVDMLVLDEEMHYEKGVEISTKIRALKNNRLSSIPIIALTSINSSYNSKFESISYIYDAILYKPVSNIELLKKIYELVPISNFLPESQLIKSKEINYSNLFINLLSTEQISDIEQFKKQFHKEILPFYYTVCDSMFIDELRQFSFQLTEIGAKYEVIPLVSFGKQLTDDVNSFNIYNINKKLPMVEEFAKLIEEI